MPQRWEGMSEGDFRGFVVSRIDEIDHKVDEVLTLLRLGKVGAEVIRWTAGVAAAIATIWGAVHFIGPK